jgi:glycosyltransferase involved in cell wall biosynthesis
MKVIMISTDRKLFEAGSEVRSRLAEYTSVLGELYVIVFAKKSLGFKDEQVNENLYLYPTNSWSKIFYLFDAYFIAKKLPEADIISSQDPFETGLVGWLIARQRKAKLQVQIHTDFLVSRFRMSFWLNHFRIHLAKFILARADGVRVVSEKIKKSILEKRFIKDANLISVLPVFMDFEKLAQEPITIDLKKKYSQFDYLILMASRFSKEKNFPLALSAFTKVLIERPKTGLIIVGEGPEEKTILNLIKENKLENNVFLEIWTESLSSYFRTVDLFLLTSQFEGYGRTLAEASSLGLPIVSTNVGIAEEAGACLSDANPVYLAKKILQAVDGKCPGEKTLKFYSREEFLKVYKKTFTDLL